MAEPKCPVTAPSTKRSQPAVGLPGATVGRLGPTYEKVEENTLFTTRVEASWFCSGNYIIVRNSKMRWPCLLPPARSGLLVNNRTAPTTSKHIKPPKV